MRKVSMTRAKAELNDLLQAVEVGETFVITRRSWPVAQLVPIQAVTRRGWSKQFLKHLDGPYDPDAFEVDRSDLLQTVEIDLF